MGFITIELPMWENMFGSLFPGIVAMQIQIIRLVTFCWNRKCQEKNEGMTV